jgi:uncharacterized protein (DUF1499 family)
MAAAAPIIALISAALAVIGLLGAWTGLLPPMAGFTTFVSGCLLGGLFSTVVALIGLWMTRGDRDPVGRQRALVGLALSLGLLIVVLGAASTGGDAPPINDITTDLVDPPAFADADRVPDYRGRDMSYPPEFVAVVREHYPDLAPLRLDEAPAEAYARALRAANGLGWEVVLEDPQTGAFYARDVTALFRFVDDVVVRIRPEGAGARIDVRSKSRDGRGDLGANAARIRALLAAIGGTGGAS